MTTKREYAVSLGLAKEGRGKLSAAAHKAIDKALSEGSVFSDPVPAPPKPKRERVSRETRESVKRGLLQSAKGETVDLGDFSQYSDEEDWNVQDALYSEYQTWRSESGQIVDGRAVCSGSGFSLRWCSCSNPRAVVSPGVMENLTLMK